MPLASRLLTKGWPPAHRDGLGVVAQCRDSSTSSLYDITEREQAEQRLRLTHLLLQTVANNVPMRVFWKDRDRRYLGLLKSAVCPRRRQVIAEDPRQDDYQMGGWCRPA